MRDGLPEELLRRLEGDVVVGRTRRTDKVRQVLAVGAARVLAVDEARIVVDTLGMGQPPYGRRLQPASTVREWSTLSRQS